jgi:hypothetical protein
MSSTKTQETKLPKWQEDFIRQEILPRGIEIADTEYTPYEGELIAGMTPLQDQALSGFGGLDTGGQTYGEAIDVQRGLSSFTPTAMGAASAGPAATYGGATVADTAAYGGATISPIERARAAQLGEVERMQGVGAVDAARAPGQIGVDTLAATDFGAYMSPYTQNVINRSLETLGGAQEQALNKLGAQATAARAFGGSRQGIAEAGTREAYGKQAADLVAGLSEKAFTQALQSGQFDIGNVQQARALQSGQQMTAETLGQQAREAGAARDQAARAGNMAAANQFATQQAQLEQQATLANQSAFNARAQAQAQLTQQAGLAAAAQAASRASQQAGLTQAAGLSNQAALNQAMQAEAARQQAANAANFQGQFTGAGIQSGAANAMAGLAGQQLQSELAGLGAQMSAGEQARALEQAQLQADYAMFQEQQAYPLSQLNAVLAAGSGVPAGLGTVTKYDPFGGLTAVGNLLSGAGSAGQGYAAMYPSDIRLKQNIAPAGSEGGVNFYTWDWNEEGKKVAHKGQPTFGVMAQELEVTHPDLVVVGEDGYRRVKYDELYKRIGR